MIEVIFLFVLGILWILFASTQDLRSREVANWLNFSLIMFALGFRFFYSLFNGNFNFFMQGVIGLAIFFALGNLLYYSRMFAGGDAKLMIALGSILGFTTSLSTNLKIYFAFFLLFLISGAVYGLLATIYFSVKYKKNFKKEFKKRFNENKKITLAIIIFGILLIISGLFESSLFVLGILIVVFPILLLYAKTVDSSCMIREVKISEASEGEWLYKQLKVGKKIIRPTWDGLTKEEIKLLRKKYKTIFIKVGIAFIPVFLVAFILLMFVWKGGLIDKFL